MTHVSGVAGQSLNRIPTAAVPTETVGSLGNVYGQTPSVTELLRKFA